jgi:hypothetical protein
MNATNETMVTTTTIRSSIQILLVKLRVLKTRRISIPLFNIFREGISSLKGPAGRVAGHDPGGASHSPV